jgi:hypothetical protein
MPTPCPDQTSRVRWSLRLHDSAGSACTSGFGAGLDGYAACMLYTVLIVLAVVALAPFILGRRRAG